MDLDAFNATLAALATNQQRQQQQQQQQQDVLTALAARLLAAPAPAPPPPAVPAANAAPAPVRVVLDPDVRYSGSNGESVNDWLQLVNRKALAENWGDDDKRRAAISSLFGKALTWQEEIGVNILDWDDWLLALRGSFEVRLTEGQWQAMVEARRQLPNEPGSTYVLEKIKICRRRSTPLNDVELIPYLIRGLYHPAHVSVMMGNPPASVNAFLVEIRRLENISEAVAVSPETISPSTGFHDREKNETAAASESMARAIESLTNQVALLTRMVNRPPSPGPDRQAAKHVTFERRPPGSRNEVLCYNCQGYGHISRDCPQHNPRWPRQEGSGNGSVGPSGQDRQ